MTFSAGTTLGRTGLSVGRIGISSSFGAPSTAIEEAFAAGCNNMTWGTFIKGRSPEMKKALKNIIGQGQREQLVLSMWSYGHDAFLTEKFFLKGLRDLGIDYADVLLLGYYPKRPKQSIIDGALRLKEKGLVRFIGLSSHRRAVFAELLPEGLFDLFHLRYNAVHRGVETEVFPFLPQQNRPGIVSFTATSWRQLLNAKKTPAGRLPATAADCYRFVLSNPNVDVCMMGVKDRQQMKENLKVLETGPMSEEEMARMRSLGDHLHR